ncbi:MAG: DUF4430 domain-containing protein [Defluviitaleaceae bacterium]|nr:DUF4430 domain-containing protein [Defluviitaleaceae bacterium]
MKKHKTKIITATVIFLMLTGAWFWGSSPQISAPPSDSPILIAAAADTPSYEPEKVREAGEPEIYPNFAEVILSAPSSDEEPEELEELEQAEYASQEINESEIETYENKEPPPQKEPIPNPYDNSFTVILTVRVDMILHNMHLLNSEKYELVPADGVIFPATEVLAYAGESVFNILQREMRRGGIHMSSRFTPVFNSAYVEAINNLYEFDVGPLSGWVYKVNGWFPNFGASQYFLSPGDKIEWHFTVDLGRDLGVDWSLEGQRDD